MPTLHLLGTGAALSSAGRTTTMLAVEGRSVIMIDCGGDAVQRLLAAGIDPGKIGGLILTHEHPDHVGGFPLLMEKLWLTRKLSRLPVHGPRPALDCARRLFEAFDTSGWVGMPEIAWNEVVLEQGAVVQADDEWRITAAPGIHGVPVIGVRIEDVSAGGVVAYSSDTAPSDAIERLASCADILVHEATGGFRGHTSATDAARLAARAGVRDLLLVHLPPTIPDSELEHARDVFPRLKLGTDGDRYTF
jgi:ribonuclease Z